MTFLSSSLSSSQKIVLLARRYMFVLFGGVKNEGKHGCLHAARRTPSLPLPPWIFIPFYNSLFALTHNESCRRLCTFISFPFFFLLCKRWQKWMSELNLCILCVLPLWTYYQVIMIVPLLGAASILFELVVVVVCVPRMYILLLGIKAIPQHKEMMKPTKSEAKYTE